jgi:hypothetical protein
MDETGCHEVPVLVGYSKSCSTALVPQLQLWIIIG